jgi:hypothetical protein
MTRGALRAGFGGQHGKANSRTFDRPLHYQPLGAAAGRANWRFEFRLGDDFDI